MDNFKQIVLIRASISCHIGPYDARGKADFCNDKLYGVQNFRAVVFRGSVTNLLKNISHFQMQRDSSLDGVNFVLNYVPELFVDYNEEYCSLFFFKHNNGINSVVNKPLNCPDDFTLM
ncbi:unnamed protein product [Parnassius mnemosyne]|uniref:Uncharacterized protein n=1 Tax=Parnassius mnemosyne TaxID=213953 RepID=A0AAV1LKM2_9NEOP